MTISWKNNGMAKFTQKLSRYRRKLQNPQAPLKQSATVLSQSAAKTWNAEGRPKWKPRKRSYSHPILDKTGRLRDSVESEQDGGESICKITSGGGKGVLEFGTRVPYGGYHQFGTSRLPQRVFLHFQEEDIREIREIFQKWIQWEK